MNKCVKIYFRIYIRMIFIINLSSYNIIEIEMKKLLLLLVLAVLAASYGEKIKYL